MKKPLVPVALATSLLLQPLANLTPLYANAATDKKGIVQLWQEIPSGQKMPKGMTQKELNEKLYCRLNHTLTPATMDRDPAKHNDLLPREFIRRATACHSPNIHPVATR